MELKTKNNSQPMKLKTREDTLKKSLATKQMSVRARLRLKETSRTITENNEVDTPETYGTEKTEQTVKQEAGHDIRDFNEQGVRSVKETARNKKEYRNSKQKGENSGKKDLPQNETAKKSVQRDKQRTDRQSKTERSAGVRTGRAQGTQLQSIVGDSKSVLPQSQQPMKKYSVTRMIGEKMSGTIRRNRMIPKASPSISRAKQTAVKIKEMIQAIYHSAKTVLTGAMAGGWLAVMLIVMVSMVGALANTPLGLFFSGGNSKISITSVIRDINQDFDMEITNLKSAYVYDELVMKGRKSVWKDVLAIYAVRTSMENPQNSQEPQTVSMITEENREILKEIFWTMNSVSASTETVTYAVDAENPGPGSDQLNQEPEYKEKTVLTIEIDHLTADQMAAVYEFTDEQKTVLAELGKDEYDEMWAMLLYGTTGGNDDILQVALSQLGNQGGVPYWAWWGYTSKVDWCAIFVSWCANECGYLEKDVFPKFQGVGTGLNWFRDRGQFREPDMYEPMPGDIIFIDWAEDGFDGKGDHVGIVEKVENGIVWTVEGNRTDSVSQGVYGLQSEVIIGYGVIVP